MHQVHIKMLKNVNGGCVHDGLVCGAVCMMHNAVCCSIVIVIVEQMPNVKKLLDKRRVQWHRTAICTLDPSNVRICSGFDL